MTDLVIDPAAARWIDRNISNKLTKGLTLVAATLAPCGDCTALYRVDDTAHEYTILWFVNDEDAFDPIQNECGAADLEQAIPIYNKWCAESDAEPVVPNWELQAHYDEMWGEPLQPWWNEH